MNRRSLFKSIAAASASGFVAAPRALAGVQKMKITRVRVYTPPNPNP